MRSFAFLRFRPRESPGSDVASQRLARRTRSSIALRGRGLGDARVKQVPGKSRKNLPAPGLGISTGVPTEIDEVRRRERPDARSGSTTIQDEVERRRERQVQFLRIGRDDGRLQPRALFFKPTAPEGPSAHHFDRPPPPSSTHVTGHRIKGLGGSAVGS